MKYVKMIGLAAIAAAALMAFVGASTASATEATCTNPPGTKVMCETGTVLEATSEHGLLKGAVEITCTHSLVQGTQSNTGGSAETLRIAITALTFTKCENGWDVTVLKKGELEIHTDSSTADGNGTVTSIGAEVTTEQTGLGIHCIFTTTTATDIGTLDGSSTTGKTATFTISGKIKRSGGRSGAFCGSEGEWSGDYTVLSPDWLDID